jgi:threo-3-hydroxy-L-aspartate ammonia-lyase
MSPTGLAADRSEPGSPSLETVREAATRLDGIANRTPVMASRTLDDRTDAKVFLKCENFQRSGSFKFRGAYNAVSRLDTEARRRGVLTYSSGNHAQAMALVGQLLDVRVTVVMPLNAPATKRAATVAYGGEVVLYDPESASREEIARQMREERGVTLIPPFDHPDIVSGQGTAALELLQETGDLDLLLVPCGGGGLLSGSALAARSVAACRVIGAEPSLADDATRSFRTGKLQRVVNPPTIADGLRTPSLGQITWPIVRDSVAEMVTVEENDIVDAMRFLWTRMKLVVEPSGAVAVAALLSNPDLGRNSRVGVLVSGGNVDLEFACALLTERKLIEE